MTTCMIVHDMATQLEGRCRSFVRQSDGTSDAGAGSVPNLDATMATTKLSGTFTQIIYSPRGGVEGLLLVDHGTPLQLVVDKDDEQAQRLASTLKTGQQLVVSTQDLPASNK